jgi:hypothetical protein
VFENLAKFEDGTRLCNVVVDDEPRFYCKQGGKKQSNKSWVAWGDMVRTMVKIDRFDFKNLFTTGWGGNIGRIFDSKIKYLNSNQSL